MAFLVIGTTAVPVAIGGVAETRRDVGEVVDAFDGTPRSSVRARKTEWRIATRMMTTADASALLSAITASPPVSVSGDLTGNITAIVTGIEVETHTIGNAVRRKVVSFTLRGL
jgi:hypothetical protein